MDEKLFYFSIDFPQKPTCRELFIHGKAMIPYVQFSTNSRIGFWYNENNIFTVIKLSRPQLVGNYTYHTIAFSSIKSSLLRGMRKIKNQFWLTALING